MSNKTIITLHDGCGVIGGTKLEIKNGNTRLLFDFGLNYISYGKFFRYDPEIDKYTWTFERHFENQKKLKILPPSISDNNYFSGWVTDEASLNNMPTPDINAVFLTHAHNDHFGSIKFLNPRIPLYCHPITASFFRQKHISLYIYKPPKTTYKNEKANNELFRKINEINHLQKVKIGDFEITAHNIDHSISGSVSYMIITPEGKKIVYSGDFRTHGILEERNYTQEWITWLKDNSPIDVLICEGTNIDEYETESEENGGSEWSVKKFILKEIEYASEKKKMAIVCLSGNNIARLDTLWEISQQLGKKLCVPVYTACLLYRLARTSSPLAGESPSIPSTLRGEGAGEGITNNQLPVTSNQSSNLKSTIYNLQFSDPSHIINHLHDLLIYERYAEEFKNKMGSTMDDISKLYGVDLSQEKSILPAPYKVIPLDYFKQPQQHENILVLWEGDIDYLPKIAPEPKTKFIHSTWEPFNEELQLDYNVLRNWLTEYDMTYHHIHVSGHTYAGQLKEVIKEISPRLLIPVHTLYPALFHDIPDVGELLILKDGETKEL